MNSCKRFSKQKVNNQVFGVEIVSNESNASSRCGKENGEEFLRIIEIKRECFAPRAPCCAVSEQRITIAPTKDKQSRTGDIKK